MTQREPEHCGHEYIVSEEWLVNIQSAFNGSDIKRFFELINEAFDTRRTPAPQQSVRKPRHPCEENGCTDWQDCDEICTLHPDFQKPVKCCESCKNIPCKVLDKVPCKNTQPPNNLPNPAENGADMGTVPKDAPNQPPGDDAVLECREIVFNRVTYGKCPYNGDCGQCFLCDNAGGCIVKTDEEIRAALRQQRGEQR